MKYLDSLNALFIKYNAAFSIDSFTSSNIEKRNIIKFETRSSNTVLNILKSIPNLRLEYKVKSGCYTKITTAIIITEYSENL